MAQLLVVVVDASSVGWLTSCLDVGREAPHESSRPKVQIV